MGFLSDLRSQAIGIYRSKDFPVLFLIGCFVFGAVFAQWLALVAGFIGFIYWQFFKRDR